MVLSLKIWDVQHGSAAYIRTPNGKHIAIDLGSGSNKDRSFSPLLYLKNKYNIDRLDKVIITHPHTDHIDDIENFYELRPKMLQRPKHLKEEDIRNANQTKDSAKIDKYLEINRKYSYPTSSDKNVDLSINNGGVNISTFHPTKCDTSNVNNHSIVTIIDYLGVKVLVPGDNQIESWQELLEIAAFKKAIEKVDIFIASHHGRENGYCAELFEHFTPRLVIISDGPATTTNVSSKYSNLATGWEVHSRGNGQSKKRYCLTTRQDGCVNIEIGQNSTAPYLEVTID